MAELEAAQKAKQQGATQWRESSEFANLLDLADVVDIPTAAEGYTGQQERDEATGDYLDKNPCTCSGAPREAGAGRLERSDS